MNYYVYILTNTHNTTFYIGITRDLIKRLYEHRKKLVKGFSSKYNLNKLIYFEETNDVMTAIEREKQSKGWSRAKKIILIEQKNPFWKDLGLQLNLYEDE